MLDPTDSFISSFDDVLGDFGLGGGTGSSRGDGFHDSLDPFGSLSGDFDSPGSTSSATGSEYSSFGGGGSLMEDTLEEADLFQSFASVKNFAARNKVRFNSMKMRTIGGGVANSSNHNSNHISYKKYEKHGGRATSMASSTNSPKVYISASHSSAHSSKRSRHSSGSGTSILLKSKRGKAAGGGGGIRIQGSGGGGGSSLICSKSSFSTHHQQQQQQSRHNRSAIFSQQHQHSNMASV